MAKRTNNDLQNITQKAKDRASRTTLTTGGKLLYKRQRIPKAQSEMDNSEKLTTQGTQEEEKQNKNTTHYVPDTNTHKQRKHDVITPTNNQN